MDSHPYLAEHGSFEGVKLGRAPVKHDARTLQFAKYLDESALPAIPRSRSLPSLQWPMYGNDRLGDCTIAAAAHLVQVWKKTAKPPVTLSDQLVQRAYWLTGSPPSATGSPGSPTDDGRNEIDVLNYWRTSGIAGDRIGAYVSINPKNHDHIRAAIYLFGGVYTGIALPLSAQGQSKWQVETGASAAAGSWGGHAVPFCGYTSASFTCVTWGAALSMTASFSDAYTEEVYAILSPDLFDETGKSSAGLNLAELQADLAAITG